VADPRDVRFFVSLAKGKGFRGEISCQRVAGVRHGESRFG
jgi:hypothetical protein